MQYLFMICTVLACVVLVWLVNRKIRNGGGCCQAGSAMTKRVRPRDRNKKHYPFVYAAEIEGMVCSNCAVRVENAFNCRDGIYASVDLSRKKAVIRAKQALSAEDVWNYLQDTSYTMINFKEERDELK